MGNHSCGYEIPRHQADGGEGGEAQAVARTMRLQHNESNSSCLVFD